jgi:hypothetical protein
VHEIVTDGMTDLQSLPVDQAEVEELLSMVVVPEVLFGGQPAVHTYCSVFPHFVQAA